MKKFLTIALLVMALCVVSVAAYAEGETTVVPESANITVKEVTSDNVVSVTVPASESAAQTVVLVVKGTEKNITTVAANESLADEIIYVDQATASGSKEFTFIPRALAPEEGAEAVVYEGPAVVFTSSGGSAVEVKTIDTKYYETFTITMTNDGVATTQSVKEGASYVLPKPVKVGYAFKGWFDGDNKEVTEIASADADVSVTAKWEPLFETVPEGSGSNGFTEGDYTQNVDNKVADTGFYADEDGNPKEYVVSVTTTVGTGLEGETISEYGFYIYNRANGKHKVAKGNGTILAGESFYAIAEGIPTDKTDVEVYFKPYAKVGETYYWGAGHGFKVDSLKGTGAGKNLGAKAN